MSDVQSTDVVRLTDTEWREFQAIPDQGYSHRAWVDAKIAGRVVELTADAQHFEQEYEDACAKLAAVEAVLNDGSSGGYWADGAQGWVRGVREDRVRAALADPCKPPASGGDA